MRQTDERLVMKQGIHVSRVTIPLEVLGCLTASMARRFKALPVAMDEETLSLVMQNPEDDRAISLIEAQTRRTVQALPAADPDALEKVIRRYYPDNAVNDGSPLALFEQLITRALQTHSSDVHIDPDSDGGAIRLRIDGMMRIDRRMEHALTADLIQAVKVAANLDIAEKRMPQDGQITMKTDDEEINLRVATVPTLHGEKITLRILATASVTAELSRLEDLGMAPFHFSLMTRALDYSHGMILLSGPTGSGKTTTLYAALRRLRESGTLHILSIEDPVEIPLNGINQVHVDSERVSFNGALRSLLRHDPDVIMIGEIRDAETADIAVKAAMTGHLVLSTLHTNDSIGVISRLMNLGITRDQLVGTLRLAVAQRLVRRPCPHCMRLTQPDERFASSFGPALHADRAYPSAVGCPLCASTGYAGRLGLYEMIPLDRELRSAILAGENEDQLARIVFSKPEQRTLMSDGLFKAAEGRTTLAEVLRVAYTGGD